MGNFHEKKQNIAYIKLINNTHNQPRVK
jgi:hypothetical protein